eukprot:12515311-Alexandrium_andersonii.AAC.1
MLHTRSAEAWLRQANSCTSVANAIKQAESRGFADWLGRAKNTWLVLALNRSACRSSARSRAPW